MLFKITRCLKITELSYSTLLSQRSAPRWWQRYWKLPLSRTPTAGGLSSTAQSQETAVLPLDLLQCLTSFFVLRIFASDLQLTETSSCLGISFCEPCLVTLCTLLSGNRALNESKSIASPKVPGITALRHVLSKSFTLS